MISQTDVIVSVSLQVDSLKKAFSRQNIEKKMNKIGTKIVSAEQREKIKQRTASLKVSPLTFGIKKVQRLALVTGSSDRL